MAKRKRSKPTSRSRAKRSVSRSRTRAKKRKVTRVKQSRSHRKNGRNPRKVGRGTKGRKTRTSSSRKPAARVRKTGKRSARKSPRFSDATRRRGETKEQYTRRLEYLLKAEREITSELTRTPTERARSHRFRDTSGEEGAGGVDIPTGFQPVGTGTGTPIGDINELTVGLNDIEWGRFDVDWDDIYDDVGEEDSDLYGEDNV